MKGRILILSCLATLSAPLTAFADDIIDRTGKWDVNAPLGPRTSTLEFATNEGTWMNIEIHPGA